MPPIELRREGSLALITLDDGKANAMNGVSLSALESALDEAEGADALVLLGRTGFFSGGLDIKTLPTLDPKDLQTVLAQFGRVMLRLFMHPRPVVAAVSGHAIAGGAVLALTTDAALAAEGRFRIGLNETQINIGLPRFVIDMARIRIAPPSLHAAVVEGRLFDPDQARVAGFVEEVVPPADIEARAIERARALSPLPQAFGTNKQKLRGRLAKAGAEAFEAELQAFTAFVQGVGG